jgi:hypothetical protein
MVALRAEVDNWRWHGVPFYLRSGKAMGASRQVIRLGFHQLPIRMFPVHPKDLLDCRMNEIVIDFADPGSITIEFIEQLLSETAREANVSKRVAAGILRDMFVVRSVKHGMKLEGAFEKIGLAKSSYDDARKKYGRLTIEAPGGRHRIFSSRNAFAARAAGLARTSRSPSAAGSYSYSRAS